MLGALSSAIDQIGDGEPAAVAAGSAVYEAGVSGFGSGPLVLTALAVGLVAVIALASVMSARKEARAAARLARSRSQSMRELLRMVRMAESIAGIGLWQYDPATGAQEWSNGMKVLFGISPDEPFVEGDAETLLYANDIDLIGQAMAKSEETEPYTLTFEVYGYDAVARAISVRACNLFGADGKVCRIVAVVRDSTNQARREKELEISRVQAMNEAAQARELAETDALTGLANRRRVMVELDQLLVDARSNDGTLALVIFDIDHFKSVNDSYGHPAGDSVLRRVAQIALAQAREGDVVGRVGGEEFVWIVPGAQAESARVMTERLRQAIAQSSAVDGVPPVTISLGYTAFQPSDTSLSMFARADGALYDAKHSGRNRVHMAA